MNAWQEVPLADYESHMQSAGQTSVLSKIFQTKLKQYGPDSLAFWGISGGNGLEQIKDMPIQKIVGIDINQKYLESCAERFSKKLPMLTLKQLDLNDSNNSVYKTDFIWAGLVFEYLNVQKALQYASNSLDDTGILSVVLQEEDSVSSSLDSINMIASNMHFVTEDKMIQIAVDNNLHIIDTSVIELLNGKKFIILDFIKSEIND